MKKKILLSVVLMLSVCMVFFVGCDKGKDVSKIVSVISSTSNSAEDTQTIKKVQQSFDNVSLANNVMEFDKETLYVGLPCDIGVTEKQVSLFAGYTKEEQLAVRNKIDWDSFVSSIKTASNNVKEITQGSKYKHIVVHAYNETDTSMTFILLKDGVMEKDIFETK